MKKCYLYARVSTDTQVGGSGLERQQTMLVQYFEDNATIYGFDPSYELMVDEGRSAFKSEHLLENASLGRFFKLVTDGKISKGSVLIVESLDRFSRENPFRCVEYIAHLDRAGIELHDVEKRLIISRRHSNSLTFATMIAERAYEESKLKSLRVKKGWDKRRSNVRENGTYMIKNCPPWISVENDRYVLNDNSKIIREIFDLYLSGMRSTKLSQILNSQGKCINGLKWSGVKVCRVLRNVRCKGDYITNSIERDFDYDTATVSTDVMKIYPPVVTDEEFAEVQRSLEGFNYRGRVRNDQKKTLFNYILKCSLCGAAMSISTSGKYTYLKCSTSREQNGCDESSMMPYTVFEKSILMHLKNIDVASIIENKGSVTESSNIKSEVEELSRFIDSYNAGIHKMKSENRMPSFDMLDQKALAEEKLVNLKDKLLAIEDFQPVKNIEYSDTVHDVSNYEERSKLEGEIRKVVKRLNVTSSKLNKSYIVADIEYFSENVIKHCLVLERKTGLVIATGEIEVSTGWRNYTIREDGDVVFKVESNDDVWTLSASTKKTIEEIRNYMKIMVGREKDSFDFTLNEDLIDWV